MERHPDAGGTEKAAKEVTNAAAVLSEALAAASAMVR